MFEAIVENNKNKQKASVRPKGITYTLKELDKINYCNKKIADESTLPFEKFAYWKAKRVIEKQSYDKEGMHDLKERRAYKYEEI